MWLPKGNIKNWLFDSYKGYLQSFIDIYKDNGADPIQGTVGLEVLKYLNKLNLVPHKVTYTDGCIVMPVYATYNPKSIDYKRGTANYCTLIYEHQGFELKIKSNGLIDLCEDITYFDYEDLTVKWNTVVQSDLKVSNLNKFLKLYDTPFISYSSER